MLACLYGARTNQNCHQLTWRCWQILPINFQIPSFAKFQALELTQLSSVTLHTLCMCLCNNVFLLAYVNQSPKENLSLISIVFYYFLFFQELDLHFRLHIWDFMQ